LYDISCVLIIYAFLLRVHKLRVEIKRGELILFDDGLPHMAPDDCYEAELRKHGLESDHIPTTPSLEIDMRRYELRRDFFQGAAI